MLRTTSLLMLSIGLCSCGDSHDATKDASSVLASDAGPVADGQVRDAGGLDDTGVDPSDSGTVRVTPPTTMGALVSAEVTATVSRGARETPVEAHVAPGTTRLPLVVVVPGLQMLINNYTATAEYIASHGFVVLIADPSDQLFALDHVAMRDDVSEVITWALDSDGVLASRIDASKIAVMGHSQGGKVAAMVAASDSRVTALLGLDLVNGGNPLTGFSEALPDIVPDAVDGLAIPVGYLGETTNATALVGQPCAPAAYNYTTFYDATTTSSWVAEWTFEGADHFDFSDSCGLLCLSCTPGSADSAEVLAKVRTVSVAFLRRHLLGEADMEAYLTGASVPEGVTVRHR